MLFSIFNHSSGHLTPKFVNRISVNWKNEEEEGKTPLLACVLSRKEDYKEWMGVETAELLILNGARVDDETNSNHSVLDTALLGSANQEMMQYLITRMS